MFNKRHSQNRNENRERGQRGGYESGRFDPRDANRYENPRSASSAYGDPWEQERRMDRGDDRDYGREPSRYGREYREEGDFGQAPPTGSAGYPRESDGYRSRDFGNPHYASSEYGSEYGSERGSDGPRATFGSRGVARNPGVRYGAEYGRDAGSDAYDSDRTNDRFVRERSAGSSAGARESNQAYRAGSYGSTYHQAFGSPENRFGTGTTFKSRGRHFGKGPKNYRRSDERLREEVNECLWHAADVDASEIEVSVETGIVTLAGSVEDRQSRRDAEMAIENIPGVIDVRNQLTVSGSKDAGFGAALGRPGKGEKTEKSELAGGKPFEGAKTKTASTGKSATDMM